jgi:7-cyano-7-deazaguanine reductase
MNILQTDRTQLRSIANPNPKIDYISLLEGKFPNSELLVTFSYVPDKLVLLTKAFQEYLKYLELDEILALEPIALRLLDDINNEVVPRWAEIKISTCLGAETSSSVIVVDQQPRWANPGLLARLTN